MEILGFNSEPNSDLPHQLKKFISQLSSWFNGGVYPELASQDLRFILDLQRKKLHSLGLKTDCQVNSNGPGNKVDTGGITFSDRVFTNSIVSSTLCLTRSITSKASPSLSRTEKLGVTAVIQNPKSNTQPDADMAMSCPHCGSPTTLKNLETGCQYCGTKFLMSELFPKVMNYFIGRPQYDPAEEQKKNKHDLTVCITACLIPFMLYCLIFGRNGFISNIISAILCSVIIGSIIFAVKWFGSVFFQIGRGFRGGSKLFSSLFYLGRVRRIDPEFSTEYFRDKAMSLFRIASYSEDPEALTCCKCQCPKKRLADIIEADLFNFGVNRCKIKDRVCEVDITLYLDCLHYTNGRFSYRPDKFRMCMRKRIKDATNLSFSFTAVNCPSCGASFDAHNVKSCPYCHNSYDLEENDWVIAKLR